MREPREAHSENYASLPQPVEVNDVHSLRLVDPGMYEAFQEVLTALRQDMLPADAARELLDAMNPSLQRELVNDLAGLDASILMTLKAQLQLVDAVLRRVVNPDGSPTPHTNDTEITPKEAINLSLKVTQMLTRDLPKLYTADRYQRMEETLFALVESKLTKEQQNAFLEALQEATLKEARKGERR